MIPLRFVIIDHGTCDDVTGEPLFWSNTDGWVQLGTPSVLKATATESEKLNLPIGNDVEWVSMANARHYVTSARHTGKHRK